MPRNEGTLREVLKLLAEVIPEAIPLIIQGIGNAMSSPEGAAIYSAGVGLNGLVGLKEIISACERFKKEPDHIPSIFTIFFGAMNVAGAVAYGHSQVLEGWRKNIQSSVGAIIQGLSYWGIIATKIHIAKKDAERSRELQPTGTTTGFSAHPQQNTPRGRGQRRSDAPPQLDQQPASPRLSDVPPQIEPLKLPGWHIDLPSQLTMVVR
ncbi:hypothetical protein [Streptomyces sp. NPDC056663]|uniref:hypothetical protein n=1 Tax=Streptomyces sp. NPDC056663 TaxID=3345899 RepID=UPI0036845961